MPVSRRAFLATQGAALGALVVPSSLLAVLEAATPPAPKLDSWEEVRKQFRLTPDYLHFAGFFIASHQAPVREAIDGYRRAIDENPFAVVDGGCLSRTRPRTSRVGSGRHWPATWAASQRKSP